MWKIRARLTAWFYLGRLLVVELVLFAGALAVGLGIAAFIGVFWFRIFCLVRFLPGGWCG